MVRSHQSHSAWRRARWQRAIAEALVDRGFTPPASDMLATVGFTLFRGALHQWLAKEAGPTLRQRAQAALLEVRMVLDEVSHTPESAERSG